MNDDEKRKLREHNQRVKDAAARMPTKGLRDSFKAFGYRADKDTSTDEGCEIHGLAMATIAKLARRNGYGRSESMLWRDLKTFEKHGVAERVRGNPVNGRFPADIIRLNFTVTMPDPGFDWDALGRQIDREWEQHLDHESSFTDDGVIYDGEIVPDACGKRNAGNADDYGDLAPWTS